MGDLSTPNSVQKLQTALHAKAKAEPGYRFYALYDKISRDDILAHAYAQCRSNKGAPGVDRQDFEAIEAYGVERWLKRTGACAQAGDLTSRTLSGACKARAGRPLWRKRASCLGVGAWLGGLLRLGLSIVERLEGRRRAPGPLGRRLRGG
ncbi:MAG: hypothetical protein ACLP4V_24765 [Methylocella sp.]